MRVFPDFLGKTFVKIGFIPGFFRYSPATCGAAIRMNQSRSKYVIVTGSTGSGGRGLSAGLHRQCSRGRKPLGIPVSRCQIQLETHVEGQGVRGHGHRDARRLHRRECRNLQRVPCGCAAALAAA